MTKRADPIAVVLLSVLLSTLCVVSAAHASGGEGEPGKLVAWQAFNLAVLGGVLFWFARKPVSTFFADRRSGIQHDLAESARLLSEAEARNAELQRRLADLGSEIEEIRESAGRRAEEESERILAEAAKAAERIRSDARAAIDQELRRARKELRDEAASAALEAAAEILREKIAEGDRDRLLDEFITRVEPTNA